MKNKVLFIILDQFADWEYSFLATALQEGILDKSSAFEAKSVSINKDPIKAICGFTLIPDYGLDEIPTDYAGIILIGGKSWKTEEAKKILPLLNQANTDGKVIGAICGATVFLGMNGLLNDKQHTSNTVQELIDSGNYTGMKNYKNEQAVRDGNLVTANGTAYLEFTKEVLTALDAFPADYIENNYQYYKLGLIEMLKLMN